jgi:hypothetical protein
LDCVFLKKQSAKVWTSHPTAKLPTTADLKRLKFSKDFPRS